LSSYPLPPTLQAGACSGGGGGITPVSLSRRYRWSTRDPPHEQLLVRLGAGGVLRCRSSPGVVVMPPSSLSLAHPRSTPRAVAREAGGGWCASLSVLSGRRHHAPVVGSSLSTRNPPREQGLATVVAGAGRLRCPVVIIVFYLAKKDY
jgi:hypothetical protein